MSAANKIAPGDFVTWGLKVNFVMARRVKQIKNPPQGRVFYLLKSLAMTYFHMANATLSSARSGFTSEFGKGSGGSRSLWSPGNPGDMLLAAATHRILE